MNTNFNFNSETRSIQSTRIFRRNLELKWAILGNIDECEVEKDLQSCGNICKCCKGTGFIDCNFCAGTGFNVIGNRVFPKANLKSADNGGCRVCDSRGEIKCKVCKGTGYVAGWVESSIAAQNITKSL